MFKSWLMIKESVFGKFKYILPEDRELQIFDFYVLSKLYSLGSLEKVRGTTGIYGLQWSGGRGEDWSREEQIDYTIKEIVQEMLPDLKEVLLRDLFYSIAAEFRHIFHETGTFLQNRFTFLQNRLNYIKSNLIKVLGEKPADLIIKFYKEYGTSGRLSKKAERELSNEIAMKITSPGQFIKIAKLSFERLDWESHFGGEAWAKICDSWFELKDTTNIKNLFIVIDHVYDLQHNTGIVFNKVPEYKKSGNYKWISQVLDYKASADIYDLINFTSPQIKKLALTAMQIKKGKSLESNKSEIDEQIIFKIKQLQNQELSRNLMDIFEKNDVYNRIKKYDPLSNTVKFSILLTYLGAKNELDGILAKSILSLIFPNKGLSPAFYTGYAKITLRPLLSFLQEAMQWSPSVRKSLVNNQYKELTHKLIDIFRNFNFGIIYIAESSLDRLIKIAETFLPTKALAEIAAKVIKDYSS